MSSYLAECDPVDGGCGKIYPHDMEQCPKCGASTTLIAIPSDIAPFIYIYDIETYPNIFTCAVLHPATDTKFMFEISNRMNQAEAFIHFMNQLRKCNAVMVGYNNIHFDYPVIHYIYLTGSQINVDNIYNKAMGIIKGENQKMIWDNQRVVRQLDLFKINHYDNKSKRTSLKALEFSMRMKSIQDLPYPPGTVLTSSEQDELISYNWHDVLATIYFYVRCLEMIDFRKTLGQKYFMNFSNMSDSKIGSEIFINRLNNAGIQTHAKLPSGKKVALQSVRKTVELKECIPDYIKFEHPAFIDILNRFKSTTLVGDNVKALFKKFSCVVDDVEYVFGAGGQHGCNAGYYESDDEYIIVDQDVGSMYPSIAIVNNYFPEHLGEHFAVLYKELVDERKRVGKKTIMGAGLKISANGTYGNSGNKYSPFYDLKYLLSTTLTGQLTLSMLVEQVIKIPNCTMIQSNTDGITYRIPRIYLSHIDTLTKWWESITMLELENAYYSRVWIADVNNYIAESMEL